MRFYLDQTKQTHSLKIDITTDDIINSEKHYKLRHESEQELQQWYVSLIDAFNVTTDAPEWEFFENEEDLEKCYVKRKQVLEKYIETEVPYVHHLQGLLPILDFDFEKEEGENTVEGEQKSQHRELLRKETAKDKKKG